MSPSSQEAHPRIPSRLTAFLRLLALVSSQMSITAYHTSPSCGLPSGPMQGQRSGTARAEEVGDSAFDMTMSALLGSHGVSVVPVARRRVVANPSDAFAVPGLKMNIVC